MEQQDSEKWYVAAFGECYPLLYAHRDDAGAARELAGLARLLGRPLRGARVLDLCCGTGRHAQLLVEAGARLTGVDLSAPLLACAAARSGLPGHLVRADMRRLPFGQPFDLVLNLFTSFGYFASDEENARALGEMARVLAAGGVVVIDHIHREQLLANLVPEDERAEGGLVIRQRREIRGDRICKEVAVRWPDGRERRFIEDVRLYRPEELETMLAAAGLVAPRIYGSLTGAPFDADAPRMVVIASRPAHGR